MIDAATPPLPTIFPIPSNYALVFDTASTDSIDLLKQLDRLLTAENVDGYVFQATPYAYENAKEYLTFVNRFYDSRPEIVSDGEGGIDIEWVIGDRKVTLSCRSSNAQNDYIYWQRNNDYDARDFSPLRLIERLHWLNRA